MMWSHPSTISRFVVSLWDTRTMWMYAAKDMATLAPHLSRHPEGIREEERFWLKRVCRNDRVPSREEPHKLRGSTKSRKSERRTADYGCVWTTELSIKPWWRTKILSHWSRRCSTGPQECLSPNPNQGRRQVQNRVSHPVQAVRAPSHAVRVDERTSYHITKLQYQSEEISRPQSNDL